MKDHFQKTETPVCNNVEINIFESKVDNDTLAGFLRPLVIQIYNQYLRTNPKIATKAGLELISQRLVSNIPTKLNLKKDLSTLIIILCLILVKWQKKNMVMILENILHKIF